MKKPNKSKRKPVNLGPNLRIVRVETLAFGGDGIGRADGKVCFIPFAAPGDLLSVRVLEDHGSFLRGEIVEIREAGPARRAPRCTHFGRCGGCAWQHLDYAAQLAAKRQILAETMSRVGRINAPVRPAIPSASEYGYRTRTRLHVDRGRIGYFERSSRRVVGIAECPILAPELEARLAALVTGGVPPATARLTGPTIEIELDDEGRLTERRSAPTPVPSRRARGEARAPEEEYAFHQVNRFVNGELVRFVGGAIADRAAGRPLEIVDLFCGNGNLSLPLAASASSLRGFDTSEESIRGAAQAARSAGFEHASYARLEAARGLESVAGERARRTDASLRGGFLCVVADPPRSGMRELVEGILALGPQLFVYVSCNPPTLARDSRLLVDGGMELELLQPLDMFPQSYHLETVALFAPAHR